MVFLSTKNGARCAPYDWYIFHVTLSSLLCSGRFVFLHGGDESARADFGSRPRAGLIAGGILGLLAPLAAVQSGCDGYAGKSHACYLDTASGRQLLFETVGRDQKTLHPILAGGSAGSENPLTTSRVRHRRRGVWQPRFWEHALRDERDYTRHFDYIHYNPVKHSLVECPRDWPYSTHSN